MKHRNSPFAVISVILFFIFIVPFIYISRYTFLSADDYCRATAEFPQFFENIKQWYFTHNGRYINSIFSYLPVYDLTLYRITLAFSFLILGYAVFFFLKHLASFLSFNLKFWEVGFYTCLFYILLIMHLPSVYEFFYWYAGTTAYLYSVVFLLLLLGVLLRGEWSNKRNVLQASILIILVNGNNEILIPLVNFIVLVVLCLHLRTKRRITPILVINVVSWISSLAVIFAPGSTERRSQYEEGGEFFSSVISTFLSSGMYTLKSIFEFPYTFLYVVIFFLLVNKTKDRIVPKTFNPLVVSALSFIGLCAVVFVPIYAIGHINVNQARIGNIIHVVFLIIIFLNIFNAAVYSRKVYPQFRVSSLKGILISCLILLLGNIALSKNYQDLFSDVRQKKYTEFNQQMIERQNYLKNISTDFVELEETNNTGIIKNFGISKGKNNWVNTCYTDYINKFYRKGFANITIK